MSLESRARDYASQFPEPADAPSWEGMCGSLTFRFNTVIGGNAFSPSVTGPRATDVMRSSHIESTDSGAAPIGAIHWWDDGGEGHVGTDVGGGGSIVFMASGALAESLGKHIGFNTVTDYNRARPGMAYQGWSRDYGGAPCPGLGLDRTAMAASRLLRKEKKMYLEWDTNGTGYLVTEDGILPLPNMQVYTLFRRVITSNQTLDSPDRFLRLEIDIMRHNLRLLALSVSTQLDITPADLEVELGQSLGRRIGIDDEVPIAELAMAYEDTVTRMTGSMNAEAARRRGANP